MMTLNEKKIALERLNRKLCAENEDYKKWLLKQPKSEILRLAPDFLVRKAIVSAGKKFAGMDITDQHYLFNDQLDALLKSETPLADICGEFFVNSDYCRLVFGDSIENAFESRANDILRREFLAAKKENNIEACGL